MRLTVERISPVRDIDELAVDLVEVRKKTKGICAIEGKI